MNENPLPPDVWARAFRLVGVPYFGMRADAPAGTHLMMQDGDAASFALHVSTPTPLLLSDKPLAWSWSANVRHAVLIDPATRLAVVRRWDDPAFRLEHGVSSDRDALRLVRKLESLPEPPAGRSVIDRALKTFGVLRTAIEEEWRGEESDVAFAFNAMLSLAERWRGSPAEVPDATLGEVVAGFAVADVPGFTDARITPRVRDYPIGELTRLLLQDEQAGHGYLLDVDLLIRHASGVLYQAAHRRLLENPPSWRQPKMWDDALPSRNAARRGPPPSDVHHTPPWLARALVGAALDFVERPAPDPLDVLDPACGSGVFLIETLRELERLHGGVVIVRGADISEDAGIMAAYSVGRAARDLGKVRATTAIQGGIDSLSEADWGQPDIVVMNPPFKAVEDLTENERKAVDAVLGSLKVGRPDLYLAFVVKAARALKPGGVLATVVPSPFFGVKSASSVRSMLRGDGYQVRVVSLFRGFDTFDDATVEAAAIVVSRSQKQSMVRFVTARKGHAEEAVRWFRVLPRTGTVIRSGFEIYNAGADALREDWTPHPRETRDLKATLTEAVDTRVSDFFSVRLGVRGVGIRGKGMHLMVSESDLPTVAPTDAERAYFRPVADRIEGGRILPGGFVFYPYRLDGTPLIDTEEQLAKAVPAYFSTVLLPAKPALIARGTTYRRWWEPSRPVKTWLAAHTPRIVSKEHGRRGNFAFDEDGHYAVVRGHGWCWKAGTPTEEVMFAYLAVFNSRTFDDLLHAYCEKVQGGQLKLGRRYVHRVPLPDLTSGARALSSLGRRMHAGKTVNEDWLERHVLDAYGASPVPSKSKADEGTAESAYRTLAKEWRRGTAYLSSTEQMIQHPSYRRILAMGDRVLPLILGDMRRRPGHWFHALQTLTGEDPVPEEVKGDIREEARVWVEWGRSRGFDE